MTKRSTWGLALLFVVASSANLLAAEIKNENELRQEIVELKQLII